MTRRRRFAGAGLAVAAAVTAALTLAACDDGGTTPLTLVGSAPSSGEVTAAPKTPPAKICGNRQALSGAERMGLVARAQAAGLDPELELRAAARRFADEVREQERQR
jgi:hypothetical protein